MINKKRQGHFWPCLSAIKPINVFRYILNFLLIPATPIRPIPRSSKVVGSGTCGGEVMVASEKGFMVLSESDKRHPVKPPPGVSKVMSQSRVKMIPPPVAEPLAVARMRPQPRVLLRKEATESAFRKYGRGFSYIHFATHGQFDSDMPLQSALLLAGDDWSDGRLTVDKLYSMNIDAEMVTLSACETGLGKVANGDDVVGLTRDFLYAGSNSIVSSLWKVDGQATGDLMTGLYNAMKDTGKYQALRQAQLSTRQKYPHPYYWASFQLTGNGD
jgi:hypothetical protein